MIYVILGLLFLIAVAGVAVMAITTKRPPAAEQIAAASAADARQAVNEYRAKPSLLTSAELHFYSALFQSLGASIAIAIKPRLADIIDTSDNGCFNKIKSKHVDFVLCDPFTLRPLLAIELDDGSHATKRAKESDSVKDFALKTAGIQSVRVATARSYDVARLLQDQGIVLAPVA